MFDPEEVAQTIRDADGNLSEAARMFGCHRETVRRYCNDFKVCEVARDESRRAGNDDARRTIRDMVNDVNLDDSTRLKAAKFWLKYYDSDARTKQDVTSDGEKVDGGGALSVTIHDSVVTVDDDEGDDADS